MAFGAHGAGLAPLPQHVHKVAIVACARGVIGVGARRFHDEQPCAFCAGLTFLCVAKVFWKRFTWKDKKKKGMKDSLKLSLSCKKSNTDVLSSIKRTDTSAKDTINNVCLMELNFDWIENWKTLNYATDLFVRAECLIVCVCVSERGKEKLTSNVIAF